MSAYICNPAHFGILAAYAATNDCVIYDWVSNRSKTLRARIENAQRVAKGLALENIRSVVSRYPDDLDGNRPGPCLKDAEILEAAAIYAAHFVVNPQNLKPVDVLKLCRGLGYQSCGTDGWTLTLACRQLDWISGAAIGRLPGYESAEWSFEQAIPEIEALYEASK